MECYKQAVNEQNKYLALLSIVASISEFVGSSVCVCVCVRLIIDPSPLLLLLLSHDCMFAQHD